jgi:hypothetical protein
LKINRSRRCAFDVSVTRITCEGRQDYAGSGGLQVDFQHLLEKNFRSGKMGISAA